MKAYANVDEWLDEIVDSHSLTKRRDLVGATAIVWSGEAWRQATRTARVQERILVGEIKKLREELQALEQRYENVWTVLVGEEDDQS